jgi:hypothetical protein
MHKVKTINRLDLIDCWGVQSAVTLHLYKGGGVDPFQSVSRANFAVLGNKPHKKLGTLTDFAHARTIRGTTADHLHGSFPCSTPTLTELHFRGPQVFIGSASRLELSPHPLSLKITRLCLKRKKRLYN